MPPGRFCKNGGVFMEHWDALRPAANAPLALGARGASVAALQRALERLRRGRYPELLALRPDGIFGHRTATAVQQYQSLAGRPASGVVGPGCWDALGADCAGLRTGV